MLGARHAHAKNVSPAFQEVAQFNGTDRHLDTQATIPQCPRSSGVITGGNGNQRSGTLPKIPGRLLGI